VKSEPNFKGRYLRDAIPIRIGNLSSSISRLGFFIYKNKFHATVVQLLQECQSFAEWTFPDADFETQLALSNLQADLAGWQDDFENQKNNSDWRAEVNAACEKWSQRLLELSGLLHTGIPK